jgi:signal transduction histidine kinase
MRARVRALDAAHLDALIAVVAFVAVVAEVSLEHLPSHGNRLVSLLFAPIVLLLAFRRRWPAASAIGFVVLVAIQSALHGTLVDNEFVPFASLLLLNLTLAYELEGRRLVVATALMAVALVTAVVIDPFNTSSTVGDFFWTLAIPVAAPIAAGRALRSRALVAREMREKAAALDRQRSEQREAAIASERDRIAHELHDIVAHDVSVMIVQAAAARRLVEKDPDRAARAIAVVEGTGREALTEMRRVVGVLRRGDEDLALAPSPGLRRLDALVDRVRSGGLAVEVRIEGRPHDLPAGVDLVAYRVLQDALDNSAHHAHGGAARVRVRYEPREIQLEVADRRAASATRSAPAPSAPPGLRGMHERVALYGGQLWTERDGEAGFTVRARLPLGGAES